MAIFQRLDLPMQSNDKFTFCIASNIIKYERIDYNSLNQKNEGAENGQGHLTRIIHTRTQNISRNGNCTGKCSTTAASNFHWSCPRNQNIIDPTTITNIHAS